MCDVGYNQVWSLRAKCLGGFTPIWSELPSSVPDLFSIVSMTPITVGYQSTIGIMSWILTVLYAYQCVQIMTYYTSRHLFKMLFLLHQWIPIW